MEKLIETAKQTIQDKIYTDLLDCGFTTKNAHEWAFDKLDIIANLQEVAIAQTLQSVDGKDTILLPWSPDTLSAN